MAFDRMAHQPAPTQFSSDGRGFFPKATTVASVAADKENRPEGWRGEGIFITPGAFRLRNFSLTLNAEGTEIVDSSMVPEIRTDTWPDWLATAEESAGRARAARADGVMADGDEAFRLALGSEFRAAMMAIASAAFAIDAFNAATLQHAPEVRGSSGRIKARILASLLGAYNFNRAQQGAARKALYDVFRFRDQAVHPSEAFQEPVQHPTYGLGMERRFVIFRVENAEAAVDFTHRLIWFCLHTPKRRYEALAEWCEAAKEMIIAPPPPEERGDDA
jgi:hypothetical protein